MNLKELLEKIKKNNQEKKKKELQPYLSVYSDSPLAIDPLPLDGEWTQGFSLDLHTISSRPIKDQEGNNILGEDGQIKWDTKYTVLGEEMHKLKYWKEHHRVAKISEIASSFLKCYLKDWQLTYLIPVPPSDTSRTFQPVYELAAAISKSCNIQVNSDILKKTKSTSQFKSVNDPKEREALLSGVFDVGQNTLSNKNVLLFDDLYRSGSTLKAATQVLKNKGNANKVYVLTITKTRSKK